MQHLLWQHTPRIGAVPHHIEILPGLLVDLYRHGLRIEAHQLEPPRTAAGPDLGIGVAMQRRVPGHLSAQLVGRGLLADVGLFAEQPRHWMIAKPLSASVLAGLEDEEWQLRDALRKHAEAIIDLGDLEHGLSRDRRRLPADVDAAPPAVIGRDCARFQCCRRSGSRGSYVHQLSARVDVDIFHRWLRD